MEWSMNLLIAICGYLLGIAFAGSFIGRMWMGTVDIYLHKVFKREVTVGKYLYWKYYCTIENPPKPPNMKNPVKLSEIILAKLI